MKDKAIKTAKTFVTVVLTVGTILSIVDVGLSLWQKFKARKK